MGGWCNVVVVVVQPGSHCMRMLVCLVSTYISQLIGNARLPRVCMPFYALWLLTDTSHKCSTFTYILLYIDVKYIFASVYT